MATKIDTVPSLAEDGGLIDANTARRKASNYVADKIGDRLMGVDPVFVDGVRPVWRVKIVYTRYDVGIVGEVAKIDVDAHTGEPLVTDQMAQIILQDGIKLAQRSSSATG